MNIIYKTSFNRDIKKIDNSMIKNEIKLVLEDIKKSKNISDISNLRKIEGQNDGYYRIKLKHNYRIGIKFEKDLVYLVRVLPRKDIYKYFP